MFYLSKRRIFIAYILLLICFNVFADNGHDISIKLNKNGLKAIRADGHAPIGVMNDHMHAKGEWMLSYRYQYMEMNGNKMGKSDVSPNFIVTNINNRFFGAPNQPAMLRVVPNKMTMDMHMFGAMYAPSDWLTLMFMSMYMNKSMQLTTYAGGMGTTVRGTFNTNSSGLGDTKITGIFKIYEKGMHKIQANAGISFPTGDTDEVDDILTPTGATPIVTLPYGMQLGSGTYDFLPGITYSATKNEFNWGAQYSAIIRTGNKNGYHWGNKNTVTGWLSYQWKPWFSSSTRIVYKQEDSISGIDTRIALPVQTANPDNYGGDIVMWNFGFNLAGQHNMIRNHRLAFEIGFPVYQNLNGVQMETDMILVGGWQYAF